MQILALILCASFALFGNLAHAGNQQAMRVACIGDSLTKSTTARSDIPWVSKLERDVPGSLFANIGLSGAKSADSLSHWTNRVRNRGYTHVMIWVGINDITADTAMGTIQTNIQTIIDQAIADGLTVILLNVTPWAGNASWTTTRQTNTDTLNTWIAGRTGVTKIDVATPMSNGASPPALQAGYQADTIHQNDAGQVVIASTIKTVMGW